MSHYSENESSCRVSIFKPSGKWDEDIAVNMGEYYNHDSLSQAVLLALSDHGRRIQDDYIYVCLDPYHKHAHPQMLRGNGGLLFGNS